MTPSEISLLDAFRELELRVPEAPEGPSQEREEINARREACARRIIHELRKLAPRVGVSFRLDADDIDEAIASFLAKFLLRGVKAPREPNEPGGPRGAQLTVQSDEEVRGFLLRALMNNLVSVVRSRRRLTALPTNLSAPESGPTAAAAIDISFARGYLEQRILPAATETGGAKKARGMLESFSELRRIRVGSLTLAELVAEGCDLDRWKARESKEQPKPDAELQKAVTDRLYKKYSRLLTELASIVDSRSEARAISRELRAALLVAIADLRLRANRIR